MIKKRSRISRHDPASGVLGLVRYRLNIFQVGFAKYNVPLGFFREHFQRPIGLFLTPLKFLLHLRGQLLKPRLRLQILFVHFDPPFVDREMPGDAV